MARRLIGYLSLHDDDVDEDHDELQEDFTEDLAERRRGGCSSVGVGGGIKLVLKINLVVMLYAVMQCCYALFSKCQKCLIMTYALCTSNS